MNKELLKTWLKKARIKKNKIHWKNGRELKNNRIK